MGNPGLHDSSLAGVALPDLVEGDLQEAPPTAVVPAPSPLLTGHVGKALLWLALPVLGEQALNMCVALFDMFLARFVGAEATVAVGLAAHFGWLIGILFGLIGTGATALVARAIGERQYGDANHFAGQAVGLGLGLGLLASATVVSVAPLVPAMFGLRSAAAPAASHFIRIDGLGQALWGVMFVGNACMRGAGDTRTPLRIMIIVNLCNMALSAALSLGAGGVLPGLGLTGIAAGTACARTIGGVLVLLALGGGMGRAADAPTPPLRLERRQMRPRAATIVRLLRIGVPAGLDGLTIWVGQLLFVRIITGLATGDLQTDTYAAHIIGIRIESLSYLSAYAWATAAATMVGQSLGAGDPARAARSGRLAARQAAIIAAALGVVYFAFAGPLFSIFAQNQRVIDIGAPAMRWLALFQVSCALMIVYPGALRGAGDTRFPLLFSLVGMACVRLPLAYVGGHVLQWGLPGAWMGMFADMTVRAMLGAWRFHQGGWKKVRV